MISSSLLSLSSLIRQIERYPCRASDILKRYHGHDWKQYIRYKFESPCEIGLSQSVPFFLVGLMENQKYTFSSPSTIRILEEEYLYRYPSTLSEYFTNSYSSYDVKQSNFLIGKNYTAFLIIKHYY